MEKFCFEMKLLENQRYIFLASLNSVEFDLKDDYVLCNNLSSFANPFHRDVCIFTVNNASLTWKHIFVHCSWKSTLVNQCSNLFLRVGKLHVKDHILCGLSQIAIINVTLTRKRLLAKSINLKNRWWVFPVFKDIKL